MARAIATTAGMLKGVIFDLDGVIINSHPIHRRAWRRFLESMEMQVSDEQLDFVTLGGKREDILRHFLGPMNDTQVQEYGRRKEQLFREEALEIEPIDGLAGFLSSLEQAEIGVGVASCGSRVRVQYVLDRLGWRDRFQCMLTGDDVVRGKPDPAIFTKAAAAMGIACEDAVVMEDAMAGVKGALAAGMKAVGIASNGEAKALAAAGAKIVAHDFTELTVGSLQELFQTSDSRIVAASSGR